MIQRAQKVIDEWIKAYDLNWEKLTKLGPANGTFAGLRGLKKEDTTSMASWLSDKKYSKAGTELPWIWVITRIDQSGQDSDIIAEVRRWNEEGMSRVSM